MQQNHNNKALAINIAAFIILAAAIGYLVYMIVNKQNPGIWFGVVLSACIVLFWLLMDVIKPMVIGEFAGRTDEQMKAYKIYCLLGLVGYAGLVWFAVAAANSTGIYGALVFLVTTMMKRKFLEEYNGTAGGDDEEPSDDADPAEQAMLEEKPEEAQPEDDPEENAQDQAEEDRE